jgi:hypothetical protein
MGKIRNLDQCHKHDEFVTWSIRHGGTVTSGKQHDIIHGTRGICALPRHAKEYPTGTRHSIIQTLIKIGLGIMAVIVLAQMVGAV